LWRAAQDEESLADQVSARLRIMVVEGLETFRRGARPANDWRVCLHARIGEPAEEISDLAADVQADLIVLGRFGHRDRRDRERLGVVTANVLRTTACPTLVLQLSEYAPPQSVTQCPACVALRADSDGERWFCPVHQASPDARRRSAS